MRHLLNPLVTGIRRSSRWLREPQARPAVTVAILAAILAFALAVRLLPTRQGLPYLHDWDEPQIASTALHMMKTGDLNPHFFHYGSLTIYAQLGVDLLHYLALMGREPIPFEIVPGIFGHEEVDLSSLETWFETGFLWEVSHPSFYLWNRGFNAVLGTLTVWVAFLLGRSLAGRKAGLLAAAILAIQGFHIERSAIVNPDVAMTLFALVAVYGSVGLVQHGRFRWLVLALIGCGLSASAKYNGVYCGLAPLAALILTWRRRGAPVWWWASLPVVPALAFLLTTPYALLDLPAFLAQAGFEVFHYAARGDGVVPTEPGWDHFVVQVRRVVENFGTVPLLFALGGMGVLARRAAGLVVCLYPTLYFLYLASTRAAFHRNLLVVYPILAVLAAIGFLTLAGYLLRAPRLGRRSEGWAWAVAAVYLLVLAFGVATLGWRTWNGQESRSRALDAAARWAEELENPSPRIGLAAELRFHRVDLERLDVAYEVRPHLELVCAAASYDLVVTGARYFSVWNAEERRRARRLNQAKLDGFERRQIGGPLHGRNNTRLDALSEDPVVEIYRTGDRVERLPDGCSEAAETKNGSS